MEPGQIKELEQDVDVEKLIFNNLLQWTIHKLALAERLIAAKELGYMSKAEIPYRQVIITFDAMRLCFASQHYRDETEKFYWQLENHALLSFVQPGKLDELIQAITAKIIK